jgi:drug/metabolite transporter (DMT)-like permease
VKGTSATYGTIAGAGIVLVVATALISGVSTFLNSFAVAGTNSDAFVTMRNVAVAFMVVPLFLLGTSRARAPLRGQDWGRLVAIGLIGGAIPFLLFFRGLELATAAHGAATASFLYRTLFLMAAVLGVVYLKEKFHWRIALAAGLLLGGNYLLLSLVSPVWTDGSLYVLAATALWAVEYSISKRALRDLPSPTVALGRMGFGAVFLVAYLGLTAQFGAVTGMSATQWGWVGISAVLLAAFVGTWYAGLARVDLGVATSVLVLGFPVTFVLSALIQGAKFTLPETIGALVVIAGVAIAIGRSLFRDTWSFLRATVTSRTAT